MEFAFGDHVLDVDRRELRRSGERIALEPQVFDLLVYLVRNRDRVVSKDELLEVIWGGRIVSESTMTSRISAARKAIGDSGEAQHLIRTVPRKGIRFVGVVPDKQKPAAPVDARSMIGADPQKLSVELKSAPRLSIVVLPFTNLSDDPEQQYFADGITEDLTTDLSRFGNRFVISRNTAFTYQDKRVDAKQIGRDLGVRYVLEGSTQRSGSQIRVNAQLIDAETNGHVWAERFDRDTGDLFALQNDITHRIVFALTVELIGKEAARPTDHPDASDYIFRGRALRLKPNSRNVHAEAISMFERALALDPDSVEGQSWLALTLANRVMDQLTDTEAADIARAEDLVGQALAASPRRALVHFAKGEVLRAQNRWEEAIAEYESVLAFNRDSGHALHALAGCKLLTGSIEEVIPLEEQAIRLTPRDPQNGFRYLRIGLVHLLQSRNDAAIPWLEKARRANPEVPVAHAFLASAYALKGETERAAAELAEARRLGGEGSYSSIARIRTVPTVRALGVATIRSLFEATYLAGLRKAGVPEQ